MSVAVIVIEVILLLIIIICAIKGLINGFLKTALSLLMVFVAIFAAFLGGKWAAGLQIGTVEDPTKLESPAEKSWLTGYLCDNKEQKLVKEYEAAIAGENGGIAELRFGLGQKVKVNAATYFVDGKTAQTEAKSQIANTYETVYAYIIFGVVFIIIFAIVMVVMGKLAKAAKKVGKDTAIGTVNKILGTVLGAVLGLVFAYALVWVFNYMKTNMGSIISFVTQEELDQSILYRFLASFDVTSWF